MPPSASQRRVAELLDEIEDLKATIRGYQEAMRPVATTPSDWHLTATEENLLLGIYAARGMVAHRERMMTALYGVGNDHEPQLKTLDVHLAKLRKKLREANAGIAIETVWGRGWRLDPDSHAKLKAAIEAESLLTDTREAA